MTIAKVFAMEGYVYQLSIYSVVFLLPLIPTVVLYYLFTKENYAQYLSKKMQLGGPVAAYVILVGLSFYHFNSVPNPELESIVKDYRMKGRLIETIRGTFNYTATMEGNDREFTGTCVFSKRGNDLVMEGETEYFKTSAVWIDPIEMELSYFFRAGHEFEEQTLGMGVLHPQKKGEQVRIDKIYGSWGIIGSPISGEVVFTRRIDSY